MRNVLKTNKERCDLLLSHYDPITGEGSPLSRFELRINDESAIYLPDSMNSDPVVQEVLKAGSVSAFVQTFLTNEGEKVTNSVDFCINDTEISNLGYKKVACLVDDINQLRLDHDFEFWAYTAIKIEHKETFEPVDFKLRGAQRKLLMSFEDQRLSHKPIRTIVCKARQWGGSTLTQMYMMWIQQRHRKAWHLAVVAHLDDAAKNIRGMYSFAAKEYPSDYGSISLAPYEKSTKNVVCVERHSIIGVGSVENPDQFRSYNYAMAHLSEVGLWTETTKKDAKKLAQSLRATVPKVELSMIVLESTAMGRGNFFHNEWLAASEKRSSYDAVFVAWWEIDMYQTPVEDYQALWTKVSNDDNLMALWNLGATLEGINWYTTTKTGENYSDLQMWQEYPSTAEEAFSSTGRRFFSAVDIQRAQITCKPPLFKGQLIANGMKGKSAFVNMQFENNGDGDLWLWAKPDLTELISNRYVVIADIGGKTKNADYSTIRVLDRYWLMEGGIPEAVATWRGHLDQDLFAWVCAQVAYYWNKALLVIESNSLRKNKASSEGDHFLTVLDEIVQYYSNIYARTHPDKIKEGVPVQYGFHTNVSTKPMVCDKLNAALRDSLIIERDIRVLNECDQFEIKDDGTLGAVDGAHDDLVIPTAIGTWISDSYMDPPRVIQVNKRGGRRTKSEASF